MLVCKSLCYKTPQVCPPESSWPTNTSSFCQYLMGFVAPSDAFCSDSDTDCSNVAGYIAHATDLEPAKKDAMEEYSEREIQQQERRNA